MELGEGVIRLIGGAILGAAFGWMLRTAPPSIARVLLSALSVVAVVLIVLLLLGLGRRAIYFTLGLIIVVFVASAASSQIAQLVTTWMRIAAGTVASGAQALNRASSEQALILWGIMGAFLNIIAGSVYIKRLRGVL